MVTLQQKQHHSACFTNRFMGRKKCVLLMNNEIVFVSFLQCKELLRNSTRSKQGDNTQKGKQGMKEALTQVVGSALANSAQIFCIGSE